MTQPEKQAMSVYKIIDPMDGEVFYYAATCPEDAVEAHNQDWSPAVNEAQPVPDDQLDILTVVYEDEDGAPTDEVVTFRRFIADESPMHEGCAFEIGGQD